MRIIGNDPKSQNGEVRAVASGALTDGSTVVVNSDGTVGVVEETGPSQSVGSPTVFETGGAEAISSTYDSNAQRVVIAYRDGANSSKGTAVVGTVSGTSISFGTPVVFADASTSQCAATYDSNSQKVVIAYEDVGNSDYGTAIVGTVSGTSISFGTEVVFETASSREISAVFDSSNNKVVVAYKDRGDSGKGNAIVGTISGTSISFGSQTIFDNSDNDDISATFDSNSNKVVIAYRDNGNSNFGTAIVGTVSGTSISFGTAVVFESANSEKMSATYASSPQKVVIAYRDTDNSSAGTAIVGTVSGTSISFGSAVVFDADSSLLYSATYDSAANKVAIGFRDGGNSNYGTVIAGTVSGTTISFGTPAVFESNDSREISLTYDSDEEKVVISYQDTLSTSDGTSVVFQAENITPNLTSENFLGISNGAYADGDSSLIQTGCSVNDAQSGLTAGQAYYVQTDGTLSETPDDPSVLAGTALSATKLLIKG